jgi:hypothetical protein
MNDFEIEDLQNVVQWVKENHVWLSQSYENAIGESTSKGKGEPLAGLQKLYIESAESFS